jgi:hypothetical protein
MKKKEVEEEGAPATNTGSVAMPPTAMFKKKKKDVVLKRFKDYLKRN